MKPTKTISLIIALTLCSAGVSQEVISHDDFVAQVKRGATINLPAGSFVDLTDRVYLPSDVTITTDEHNPATIRRSGDARSLLNPQGRNITIENVVLDFAMEGEWRRFCALIEFKYPAWKSGPDAPDAPIEKTMIRNVTFINSSPPPQRGRGDCWGISFAHNNGQAIKNTLVTGCRSFARQTQLTANGQGRGGISGLEISGNYVEFGEANSIAVSTATDDSVFENILITDNEIRRSQGIGIFVGLDGGKGFHPLTMYNIQIRRNKIDIDTGDWRFPNFVYVRTAGPCDDLIIEDNTFNSLYTIDARPRWLSLFGNPDSPANYAFRRNILMGNGSTVIRNATKIK